MTFYHAREALQNAASFPRVWLQVLHASMHKTEQNKQALLKHELNGASLCASTFLVFNLDQFNESKRLIADIWNTTIEKWMDT